MEKQGNTKELKAILIKGKAAKKEAAERDFKKREKEAMDSFLSAESLLKRKTPKSKEEILSSGTARDKVLLFIADGEVPSGNGDLLTEKEYNSLYGYLSEMRAVGEDEKEALFLIEGYQAFIKMRDEFHALFYIYQRDTYNLGRLFEKLRAIEEKEEAFRRLFKEIKKAPFATPELIKDFPYYVMSIEDKGVNGFSSGGRFFFNNDGKEKLSYEICAQYNRVEVALGDIKAYIVAIDELLVFLKVDRGFLPITMEEIINDITKEFTLDRMEIEDLYRKSNLRKKRAAKENISRREMEEALFPDYENIDKNEYFYKKAQKELKIEIFI